MLQPATTTKQKVPNPSPSSSTASEAMSGTDRRPSALRSRSPGNTSNVSFSSVKEEKKVDVNSNSNQGKKEKNKQGLLRRFFGDKRKHSKDIPDPGDENDVGEAEDPVMTVFAERNTHRVRFSITEEAQEQSPQEKSSGNNVKQFMSRALFSGSKSSIKLQEEMEREVAQLGGSLVWENAEGSAGPEVSLLNKGGKNGPNTVVTFTDDPKIRARHAKLLNKAYKAQNAYFRYEFAVKCYLKALNLLKSSNYPETHPSVTKTVELLNNAHQVLSSYNSSVRIVKIGIKHEDKGELVKALKMYTIAYRIRRDNLSRNHPSHVVLLNMLGSIQVKRGDLKEAMLIYELALKDGTVSPNEDEVDTYGNLPIGNLLAKSVTFREIGIIKEHWGDLEEAMEYYHQSLECVQEWKEAYNGDDESFTDDVESPGSLDYSLSNVRLEKSTDESGLFEEEKGEMELCLVSMTVSPGSRTPAPTNKYEDIFPKRLEKEFENRNKSSKENSDKSETESKNINVNLSKDAFADMDLALTLHHIAQLHRKQGNFAEALEAFEVALRGMKYSLGRYHPNVAAVLGNVGNLQKEMGDLDAAYKTYQEVLAIESYRLGLSHPDVAITLHNVATIDAARGKYRQSLDLYSKVLGLQRKLFGAEHVSVAITSACMGDVHEKLGENATAIQYFEDALKITSMRKGKHSLEVARLLHKLSKLAIQLQEYHTAGSHISRAVLIYRLNKVHEDHEWLVDANRDAADIDAAIALKPAGIENRAGM